MNVYIPGLEQLFGKVYRTGGGWLFLDGIHHQFSQALQSVCRQQAEQEIAPIGGGSRIGERKGPAVGGGIGRCAEVQCETIEGKGSVGEGQSTQVSFRSSSLDTWKTNQIRSISTEFIIVLQSVMRTYKVTGLIIRNIIIWI